MKYFYFFLFICVFSFSACQTMPSVPIPGETETKTNNIYIEYMNIADSYMDLNKYDKAMVEDYIAKEDIGNNKEKQLQEGLYKKQAYNEVEYGKEEKRCDDCGKVIDARLINYGEHLAGDWVIEVESNCSHKGSEIQLCQTCDELLNTREIPLGDHVVGEWEELIVKTCTEDGERVKKCTVCNEELEKEIIPASHTEVIDKAVKATCYKTGLTQGSHCSECEKVLVAQKVIPITHSVVVVKGKPATCTESGLTDGQKCSICDIIQ